MSGGKRHDLGFDGGPGFGACLAEVEFLLEADPEFGTGSEVAAEPQRGVRGDGAAAANDGGDAAVRDFKIRG